MKKEAIQAASTVQSIVIILGISVFMVLSLGIADDFSGLVEAPTASVAMPILNARFAVLDLGTNMTPIKIANSDLVLMKDDNGNFYRWQYGAPVELSVGLDDVVNISDMSEDGTVVGYGYSGGVSTLLTWQGTNEFTGSGTIEEASSAPASSIIYDAFLASPGDNVWTQQLATGPGIDGLDVDGFYSDTEMGNVVDHLSPIHWRLDPEEGLAADRWTTGAQTLPLGANANGQDLCSSMQYNPSFIERTNFYYNPAQVMDWSNDAPTYSYFVGTAGNSSGTTLPSSFSSNPMDTNYFAPISLSSAGGVIGELNASSENPSCIYWDNVVGTQTLPTGFIPQSVNGATNVLGLPAYQIVSQNCQLLEMDPNNYEFPSQAIDILSYLPFPSPWNGLGVYNNFPDLTQIINDGGIIVGTATYSGTNTAIPAGLHGVMLAPSDYAPSVLKVNSSFNEQKINSTTLNAQPDNYDESLTIAFGPNAGQLATTNLHQNFFGIKPGTMPNSFFQNATVTITKLNNTDTDDGTGLPETGTIRLYAIQNVGQSGAESYPIPISLPGQTLPHSTVPFTTSISTDQPANLVPILYSDSAIIPQGSSVTYWMEGVDPGPITLEYRIHFNASGSTPDVVVDQHFLVCTQQSKAAWQADIQQEILLQSGVDISLYTGPTASAPFRTDKLYVQTVYSYYQELFTQKSTLFGWAGLAKMAGAPVYGAMDDAEYGRTVAPSWIPGATTIAGSMADLVQSTLILGNYDIFDDLAWQYRAYQASGIWALRYTNSAGLDTPAIRPIDLSPWNELYQGDYSSTPALVTDASLQILQREQEYIAQPAWDIFHASSIPDFVFSTLTSSPLSSGASFTTVMGYSADITVYSDRWNWITNPTQGMWQQWNGYSNSWQVALAGISLEVKAEPYSFFYSHISSTTYPIIW